MQSDSMYGLAVDIKSGETIRRKLVDLGLLDNMYAILNDGRHIFFPLVRPDHEFLKGKQVVEMEFPKRDLKPKTLAESIGFRDVRSFDIIGDIAIIEMPESARAQEKMIGEELLKLNKNIKTVFAKESSVQGEYRVRGVRLLAGENKTETVHREHGCRFKVDVSKVYFSPRLSHERGRILSQVKDGEHILALFSGVAPFPIVIAKKKRVSAYSIELNPEGHKYALENVKLNKVEGRVIPLLGDVKEILKDDKFCNWADRIIMPLPKDAINFLPFVVHTARKGCIIHVYGFAKKGAEKELGEHILRLISRPAEIIYSRKVRTYSPDTDQFVFDVKILE